MSESEFTPPSGARAITVEYPDGTRLLWTREIPSNTWRCQILTAYGESMPAGAPIITGYDRPEMDRILETALRGTQEFERPHTQSLRRWLYGAQIAGQGPKLTAPVDSDDYAYLFRSNDQAADVAVKAVVEWLLAEAGQDGAHGSIPALRAAANHIERQEKVARKRQFDSR